MPSAETCACLVHHRSYRSQVESFINAAVALEPALPLLQTLALTLTREICSCPDRAERKKAASKDQESTSVPEESSQQAQVACASPVPSALPPAQPSSEAQGPAVAADAVPAAAPAEPAPACAQACSGEGSDAGPSQAPARAEPTAPGPDVNEPGARVQPAPRSALRTGLTWRDVASGRRSHSGSEGAPASISEGADSPPDAPAAPAPASTASSDFGWGDAVAATPEPEPEPELAVPDWSGPMAALQASLRRLARKKGHLPQLEPLIVALPAWAARTGQRALDVGKAAAAKAAAKAAKHAKACEQFYARQAAYQELKMKQMMRKWERRQAAMDARAKRRGATVALSGRRRNRNRHAKRLPYREPTTILPCQGPYAAYRWPPVQLTMRALKGDPEAVAALQRDARQEPAAPQAPEQPRRLSPLALSRLESGDVDLAEAFEAKLHLDGRNPRAGGHGAGAKGRSHEAAGGLALRRAADGEGATIVVTHPTASGPKSHGHTRARADRPAAQVRTSKQAPTYWPYK
ncbi:hypothetical protein HYH03_017661 [Edaphochlamys debaryana]|uniref:Uncharacterized protein n=1 Tax=Edaphochlamys debaryana TaxID=47281 RepID=A0A835XHF8_9CHLO|nr:hypothetical protein HYH03_017661 [Edaphochlamys debaryana]|eukprot:KAG2483479.1 hypothetical protein HYH03_017661 [Edaphochlamys debaryana]